MIRNLSRYLGLADNEEKTFALHFSYAVIEGLIAGVLLMNEFVFIKSLGGGNRQLAMLFQFSVIVLLAAMFINTLIKRIGNIRQWLMITGIITRGPLLLLLLFPKHLPEDGNMFGFHVLFLVIFLVFFSADPFILPTINRMLKQNYSYANFGRLYSLSISAKKITELISLLLFSLLLEYDSHAYVYVYPCIGAMGVISILILTRINTGSFCSHSPVGGVGGAIKTGFTDMIHILTTNRAYRDLEIGFMCYGCALMMSATVIAVYLARELSLNFLSIGLYKNGWGILVIFLLPLLGRIIGTMDPRKFAIFTYASLALHIFFVGLTSIFPHHLEIHGFQMYPTLVAAYIFFGLFSATMVLLWGIGSAYFCAPDEAAAYQSVHMTLAGFRGLFAPLLGIQLYMAIGYAGVFGLSVGLLFTAVLAMVWSLQKVKIHSTGIDSPQPYFPADKADRI
ncbi:MAG: hypothetical protein HKM93_21705 [Desulfobacteraceae bacterium]|nr:hypothetical protein [Desulfobacteraceae bacterium]